MINAAEIQEPVELGQRVQSYQVEAVIDGVWKVLSQGTDIGGRRLDRFPQVTTWKVRLTILAAKASPAISKFGLYLDTALNQKTGVRSQETEELEARLRPFSSSYLLTPVSSLHSFCLSPVSLARVGSMAFAQGLLPARPRCPGVGHLPLGWTRRPRIE